jgi:hypothetical protein
MNFLPLILTAATAGGRAVFRSGQRITDDAATDALSRLFSRPDLIVAIGKMRKGRMKTAVLGQVLHEVGAELSNHTEEPVHAIKLEDGVVIPLSTEDGQILKKLSDVRERTKQIVEDQERELRRGR